MSSVVDRELSEYFGFTREEVSKLFDHIGVRADIETISQWYGGYGFEDLELFNPWSILWFANRRTFEPYWVNTGSNETVASMIQKIPGSL